MDKRTLIFVLSLTMTLFLVNTYFQSERQENVKEWHEQQLAKKQKKKEELEQDIAQNTAKASSLPLADLYVDAGAKTFLSSGVLDGDAILTVSWEKDLPKKVFARPQGENGAPQEYTLTYSPDFLGGPTLYQKAAAGPLPIGYLPSFGTFNLQLVVPQPGNETSPVKVMLGKYVDGQFSIPEKTVEKLTQDLAKGKPPESKLRIDSALVLIKSGQRYYPVAVYQLEPPPLLFLDYVQGLPTQVVKPDEEAITTFGAKPPEKFFVLENDYQQLVFSNYGGSLVEINLPFQTKDNPKSVVKEIEFDREMVKDHPYNAHFPSHPYMTPDNQEHSQGKLGGYYPLIRRDLIQVGNRKSVRVHPQYYALNIVSEYPEVAELVYEVKSFDKEKIVFEGKQRHRTITKTFSIASENEAPYSIDVTVNVDGDSRGLWVTSGVPEVELISGSPAPALKYRITRNKKVEVVNLSIPTDTVTVSSVYPDWIANSNGFLGLILDPLTKNDPGYRTLYIPGEAIPSRIVEIGEDYERFKPKDLPGYMAMLPLRTSGGPMKFRVFAGPFADSVLKTVDKVYTDPTTGYNPDYLASQSFHGWFSFISEPFAKFLFVLMNAFHNLTGSWAFSIVLLTAALRLMLYPLNAWSTKSMLRMQHIAPQVKAIQEKHKKDQRKAQLEIMNLYRDAGVNPLTGCFPLLIQMPFLIGMFDLLKSTFELRGASFIPGWIDNLTAPDVLFSWETPIPFIGTQFHLLPFLLGGVMFLQQRMMSTLPKDPSQLTDQQKQQKTMGNVMAIVFTVMFYHFPSGLNIYWLSSMLLGMLQQWWTAKTLKPKIAEELKKKALAKQRKR